MPTVLITGASSGFGLAAAIELAKRNWTVVATMRDLKKRGELDKQIAAAGLSNRITVDQLDVSNQASIDRATANLNLDNRPLDAVVHNAGVAIGGAFEDLSDAQVRHVLDVNFFGVLALTRRLLPHFRTRQQGRIVVISSEVAFAGQPAISPYCASKWAIEGWAESLAYEVAHFNIDVVLIEPGAFKTNIWDSSPRVIPEGSAYKPLVDHLEAAVAEHVELTAGDPHEVAVVIAKALEARRPKFRYAVGRTARIGHFLKGKIATRFHRKLVNRYFALNRIRWP